MLGQTFLFRLVVAPVTNKKRSANPWQMIWEKGRGMKRHHVEKQITAHFPRFGSGCSRSAAGSSQRTSGRGAAFPRAERWAEPPSVPRWLGWAKSWKHRAGSSGVSAADDFRRGFWCHSVSYQRCALGQNNLVAFESQEKEKEAAFWSWAFWKHCSALKPVLLCLSLPCYAQAQSVFIRNRRNT